MTMVKRSSGTRPMAKKESLKDIIEAVAAKETLLKPLPKSVPSVVEEKPIGRPVRQLASPGRALAGSFLDGIVKGIGFLVGVELVVLTSFLLIGWFLSLPGFAQYLQGLVTFLKALIAIVRT